MAEPGPNTRQSTININLSFGGDYFDEIDLAKNDVFRWRADGFKYTDRNGDGTTSKGQSNRFWSRKQIAIPFGETLDLDLYGFLVNDAGKGLGQDQLGLPLIMNSITMLSIRNSRSSSGLLIGDAPIAPWTALLTGTANIPPGYRFFCQTRSQDAWDVIEGVSQYLRLEPQGSVCKVDVHIAGRYVYAS